MAVFRIRIAGYTAQVESLFDSTRDYCRAYLTEEEPKWHIRVNREDLIFEQDLLDAEALEEGLRRRAFSEPFLERTVIQRKLAEKLFGCGILMLHGSTVAVDGEAYLFTAKCGTGKSTHTRLWREVFGDRAVMVNDDKPFLRPEGKQVLACGAPWSGKHGLDTNVTVPLKGICILERGSEDRIVPIAPEEAREMLEKQSFCPPGMEAQFREMVDMLLKDVPLWRMSCTKSPQAARCAYRAMAQKDSDLCAEYQ